MKKLTLFVLFIFLLVGLAVIVFFQHVRNQPYEATSSLPDHERALSHRALTAKFFGYAPQTQQPVTATRRCFLAIMDDTGRLTTFNTQLATLPSGSSTKTTLQADVTPTTPPKTPADLLTPETSSTTKPLPNKEQLERFVGAHQARLRLVCRQAQIVYHYVTLLPQDAGISQVEVHRQGQTITVIAVREDGSKAPLKLADEQTISHILNKPASTQAIQPNP